MVGPQKAIGLLLLLALVPFRCTGGGAPRSENRDQKWERQLQPAIGFVEATLADKQRLPTQDEFFRWNKRVNGTYILLDRSSEYAVSKGAKEAADYMVGVWRSEWYHYYKSWDQTYLNASDEMMFEQAETGE